MDQGVIPLVAFLDICATTMVCTRDSVADFFAYTVSLKDLEAIARKFCYD